MATARAALQGALHDALWRHAATALGRPAEAEDAALPLLSGEAAPLLERMAAWRAEFGKMFAEAYAALALQTLAVLTPLFTAEFAIRPFIVAHPQLAFATLRRWTTRTGVGCCTEM